MLFNLFNFFLLRYLRTFKNILLYIFFQFCLSFLLEFTINKISNNYSIERSLYIDNNLAIYRSFEFFFKTIYNFVVKR